MRRLSAILALAALTGCSLPAITVYEDGATLTSFTVDGEGTECTTVDWISFVGEPSPTQRAQMCIGAIESVYVPPRAIPAVPAGGAHRPDVGR